MLTETFTRYFSFVIFKYCISVNEINNNNISLLLFGKHVKIMHLLALVLALEASILQSHFTMFGKVLNILLLSILYDPTQQLLLQEKLLRHCLATRVALATCLCVPFSGMRSVCERISRHVYSNKEPIYFPTNN